MMKMPILFKASAVAVIGFGLAYYFYQLSGYNLPMSLPSFDSEKWHYQTFHQPVSFTDVTTVEIEAVNEDVLLEQGKQAEGRISFTSQPNDSHAMSITKSNHIISIRLANQPSENFSSVTIKLPKGIKTIRAKTVLGDIKLSANQATDIKLESVSGDITLDDIGSLPIQLDVATVFGDIDASLKGETDNIINAKSISGDVSIGKVTLLSGTKHEQKGLINLHSVAGDITLNAN